MALRLCLVLLFACLLSRAAENPSEILTRIDAKVLQHLAKTVNYTCVETVNREYFTPAMRERASCKQVLRGLELTARDLELTARDRLKLDVAVTGRDEMYSWHAAHHFSTTLIDRIVREGPIGSGGFVGFLENIFGVRGVRFRFEGRQTQGAAEVFSFEYAVPLSASHYVIEFGKHKKPVAFHGSFLAYTNNYELASMTLIADKIPKAVHICASRNWINYQLVKVAGNELLLPKEWTLGLTTPGLSTTSRSEYTNCREFSSQATISYKNLASSPAPDSQPPPPPQVLPAKLKLKIRLLTPIDGQHSSAGDPVRGELSQSVAFGHGERIPSGAIVSGVITRLEQVYRPSTYYLLNIEFDSIHSGSRSFILRAQPKLSPAQIANLRQMVHQFELPATLPHEAKHGVFVFPSGQLQLRKHFSAEWVTEPLSASR